MNKQPNIMNYSKWAIAAALTLTFVACKKDKDEDDTPTPSVTTGTIKANFTFMNGSSAFNMNDVVMDGAGHNVQFSLLKFYMSDFHLVDDADNTVGEFHETVILLDASTTNEFTLGSMSPGHVHEAHVALGLDSATNHADFTMAESPLNNADMYWFWSPAQGYKFLAMEGKVDGNGDGDFVDPEDVSFLYHCATDALLRETHIHVHQDVTAGSTVTMQATVDVARVISGLDLLAVPDAMGDTPANVTAMDSLAVSVDGM